MQIVLKRNLRINCLQISLLRFQRLKYFLELCDINILDKYIIWSQIINTDSSDEIYKRVRKLYSIISIYDKIENK